MCFLFLITSTTVIEQGATWLNQHEVDSMIIVTGANGKLGRAIVEQLLTRVPADQIGVSVRDTEKAHGLAEQGVRVRQGDFDDPASLAYAFEGASQVLIVSSNSSGELAVQHHRTAIDAAKKVGVRRILYTSHMGASPTSLFPPMVDHAATEAVLRESGVAYTSLRNGFYTDSALMILGNAIKTGELRAPEDGPVAWTSHSDLAEVTAITLSEDILDGITPNLTASEALDLGGIAAIASELAHRPIQRVVVPDAEYRAGLIAHGVPEAGANMLLGIFLASRQGDFSQVDPTLAHLINRPPTPLRDVLKATIASAG